MSDYDKPVTAQRERQPGLRKETVQEILKKRHAYPHEIVAMAAELLELREILNRSAVLNHAGDDVQLIVPSHKVVGALYSAPSQRGKDLLKDIAEQLDGGFTWEALYPGYGYWDLLVNRILRKDLQK